MQGIALTAATQRAVREGLINSQEGAARLVAYLHHKEAELVPVSDQSWSAAMSTTQPSSVDNGHEVRASTLRAFHALQGAAGHPPAWILEAASTDRAVTCAENLREWLCGHWQQLCMGRESQLLRGVICSISRRAQQSQAGVPVGRLSGLLSIIMLQQSITAILSSPHWQHHVQETL